MVRKKSTYGMETEGKRLQGSVTVEASLGLIFFLFCFCCLIQFYNFLNLEVKMQSALEQTADLQAAFAAVSGGEEEQNSFLEDYSLLQCSLDYLFARVNVIRILGNDYLDHSWIRNGSAGLDFSDSSFFSEEDEILELVVSYTIEIPLFSAASIRICQHTKRRVWAGDDSSDLGSDSDTETMVYITPTGKAYHLYEDCSYIDVKVYPVDADSLSIIRNKSGGIYYPCEVCQPEQSGTVYIALYGTRFHRDSQCKAIERNCTQIPISEVGSRYLCSKCAKRAAS